MHLKTVKWVRKVHEKYILNIKPQGYIVLRNAGDCLHLVITIKKVGNHKKK